MNALKRQLPKRQLEEFFLEKFFSLILTRKGQNGNKNTSFNIFNLSLLVA